MSEQDPALERPEDLERIGPGEIAYRLGLTAAELKITHAALHALLDGYGHREHDVREIVHRVLDKLPDEHVIRAIDLSSELRRRPRA